MTKLTHIERSGIARNDGQVTITARLDGRPVTLTLSRADATELLAGLGALLVEHLTAANHERDAERARSNAELAGDRRTLSRRRTD
ncbi:hypothetical protein GCM10023094_28880 [Rhodococcus olei]|uniref:YbaB/EbfC DNA-binding family protein n=1 Tax=Rhodococcus olei TaxID=2161675 RepID=A0ABP8P6A2_9NOCA